MLKERNSDRKQILKYNSWLDRLDKYLQKIENDDTEYAQKIVIKSMSNYGKMKFGLGNC